MNNKGPNMDPCGTPVFKSNMSDLDSSKNKDGQS